jgi:hypothetical protein
MTTSRELMTESPATTQAKKRPELGPGQLIASEVAEDHVMRRPDAVDPIDGVERIARDFHVVTGEAVAQPEKNVAL